MKLKMYGGTNVTLAEARAAFKSRGMEFREGWNPRIISAMVREDKKPTTPLGCPFCGYRPRIEQGAGSQIWYVTCDRDTHSVTFKGTDNLDQTIKKWNRRRQRL
jgi:hypothetical protein